MAERVSGGVRLRRFFRYPVVVTIVAVLIGSIAGCLVFLVSDVNGWRLFLLRGALIGVITGLAMVVYLRHAESFVLSEVTLSVPEFAAVKFVANAEYRRVAWKLFIETLTRIATQPLPSDDGSLREALSSLHGVFTGTRNLLKDMEPSKPTPGDTVEMLAVRMLNNEIRPFLAKWHVQLRKFELLHPQTPEVEWPQNADCRSELERLRSRLVMYTLAFGELAGVQDAHAFLETNRTLQRA